MTEFSDGGRLLYFAERCADLGFSDAIDAQALEFINGCLSSAEVTALVSSVVGDDQRATSWLAGVRLSMSAADEQEERIITALAALGHLMVKHAADSTQTTGDFRAVVAA